MGAGRYLGNTAAARPASAPQQRKRRIVVDEDASNVVHDYTLARNVTEHLCKKYPGHPWACTVYGGVIQIRNWGLSGNWGFQIREEHLDNDYKIVTRAGGELLERYRLSRGRVKEHEIANLARDFRGTPIGDFS